VKRPPRSDLALDPAALGRLLGTDAPPREIRLLKETDRRLVVRYELEDGRAVVGKWFSTDRGAIVADALSQLGTLGLGVPALVAYVADARALFVEAVDAPLLREALRERPEAARAAGAWLAAFHRSGFTSPRPCGPEKQRRAVERWSEDDDRLRPLGSRLARALARLPDPRRPVHYDYYHSQLLVPADGPTVALDLDEAGVGDPAFDVAHFLAHLELLALQWYGDPGAFGPAAEAFLDAYAAVASPPRPQPALEAFAWFKLAYQAHRRAAASAERTYAVARCEEMLSTA
jgi:aminoglycoside phosphotransferase (APT) family kinase protein